MLVITVALTHAASRFSAQPRPSAPAMASAQCPVLRGPIGPEFRFDLHVYARQGTRWRTTRRPTAGERVRLEVVFQSHGWKFPASSAKLILFRHERGAPGEGRKITSWPMQRTGLHRGPCWLSTRFSAVARLPRHQIGKLVAEAVVYEARPALSVAAMDFKLAVQTA